MATDQGMDPAESQPPFFSLGLVFFRGSKQSLCYGRVVSGTSARVAASRWFGFVAQGGAVWF